MARITGYIFGLTALAVVLTTSLHSTTIHYKTSDRKAQQYYTVNGSGTFIVYDNTISPAMAADLVVFEPLKFKYPRPVNAGKFDNRLAFAQYHIDYNVAAHYRS